MSDPLKSCEHCGCTSVGHPPNLQGPGSLQGAPRMMALRGRRKHFKITQLPKEIREAVNQKIIDGHTYPEIAAWLKEVGHPVGKSSIGRYGKDLTARLWIAI